MCSKFVNDIIQKYRTKCDKFIEHDICSILSASNNIRKRNYNNNNNYSTLCQTMVHMDNKKYSNIHC